MNRQAQRRFVIRCCGEMLFAWVFIAIACAADLAAEEIFGQVRNETRLEMSAGDQVLLFRPEHAMQEEARTQTDSQGRFTLSVRHSDKSFLLRVVHQGVNYDVRASSRAAVSVDVFEAAAKVDDIIGTIEIIRAGTVGKMLHVSDMMELQNRSSPPRTQSGPRTFDVYLPPAARIDTVFAAGAGNVATALSAHPIPGEPGHYSVSFPLRPGSTKFAFNYDLPYGGRAVFPTRHEYPLQQLAVMAPPTMRFSSRSAPFQILPAGNKNYQVHAIASLKAGLGPEFSISGGGALPPVGSAIQAQASPPAPPPGSWATTQAQVAAPIQTQTTALAPARPDAAQRPEPTRSSSIRIKAILSLVFFATIAIALWRALQAKRVTARNASAPLATPQSTTLLEDLKEELFQLEAARIRGLISTEACASTRKALERSVTLAVQGRNVKALAGSARCERREPASALTIRRDRIDR